MYDKSMNSLLRPRCVAVACVKAINKKEKRLSGEVLQKPDDQSTSFQFAFLLVCLTYWQKHALKVQCVENCSVLMMQTLQNPNTTSMSPFSITVQSSGNKCVFLGLTVAPFFNQNTENDKKPKVFKFDGSKKIHYTQTVVQRRQRSTHLNGWTAAKKPLLKMKNKRIAWARKHGKYTSHQWKSILEIFGFSRRVFVRHREVQRIVSACVVHLSSTATAAFCSDAQYGSRSVEPSVVFPTRR